MKKILLNLDKSKKYVVACSYGPDSMALLALALKEKNDIVVAHVNYHKRDVSNYEQKSLSEFCQENNVPIEILDTVNLQATGNFQEWAREIRYKFFNDVVQKYNADAVLVAHQEDDLIETYLMQKKRGNLVKYQGIARENTIFGVKVIRPLLGYSKQELLDFDNLNNIPYSIDVSNLTDHYTRNQFRHHVVSKLTKEERAQIVSEVNKQEKRTVSFDTEIDLPVFKEFDYEVIVKILDYYMNIVGEHRDLSRKYIEQIKKAFSDYGNMWFDITESIVLEQNYDIVSVVNKKKLNSYSFVINKKLKNEIFDIDFSESFQDRGIKESDFPLVVKNLSVGDKVKINDYFVDVRRLFIDWKVPHYLRCVWPGIYNSKNELVYVPRYRRNFKDEHKSKFVLRTGYFREF